MFYDNYQNISGLKKSSNLYQTGFTIVELLIVIVVITILAAITIVTYNGVSKRAAAVTLQSDLRQIADQLGTARVDDGSYPLTNTITPNTYFKHSDGTNLEYTSTDGTAFCITASSTQGQDNYYFDSAVGKVQQGKCSGHTGYTGAGIVDGSTIQTITSTNCPATRTRAVDARDNHTYWVQKLGDGKCWMLTNLAYAGNGTNTYGDTKTLVHDNAQTYTVAEYYIPTNSNPTPEPTAPSTSTDGGATNPQYGYLYNWCAAMGAQSSTSACSSTSTPVPNTSISICPAGWRLPTGNSGGEFAALNTAVNSGSSTTDAGLLTKWLAQRSGYWQSGYSTQGSHDIYYSSTQYSGSFANLLDATSSSINTSSTASKYLAAAVRCLAN